MIINTINQFKIFIDNVETLIQSLKEQCREYFYELIKKGYKIKFRYNDIEYIGEVFKIIDNNRYYIVCVKIISSNTSISNFSESVKCGQKLYVFLDDIIEIISENNINNNIED